MLSSRASPPPLLLALCLCLLLSLAALLSNGRSALCAAPGTPHPSSLPPLHAPAPAAFSQRNRSVIVTGSSKGIGKGIATVFAEAGARVLVTSRHIAEAQAVADEIVAGGGVALAFAADVSDEAEVEALVSFAASQFGGVDVVCANAGIIPTTSLEEMTAEDWDSTMAVNAKGTFLSVKHALPFLKKSAYGRVILTSSITGPITGYPGWAHYGASKAAQLGFMRSAAVELAHYDITVNAIQPGNVLTEGLAVLGEEFLTGVRKVIPTGDLGTPRDIGYATLFLASREAGFITGQTLVLDGGQVLPETPDFRSAW